jgi:glycosyltransferase involved in cell wall biosynthesis
VAAPPVVVYTSVPFRGLETLLKVWPAVRAAVPTAQLHLYSSMRVYGHSAAQDETAFGTLYAHARSLDGVRYIGSVPQAALMTSLAAADVWAYPCSFEETSCLSAMEALAAGCCAVTTATGALAETVADAVPFDVEFTAAGPRARLVPHGDVAAFTAALVASLQPPAVHAARAARAAFRAASEPGASLYNGTWADRAAAFCGDFASIAGVIWDAGRDAGMGRTYPPGTEAPDSSTTVYQDVHTWGRDTLRRTHTGDTIRPEQRLAPSTHHAAHGHLGLRLLQAMTARDGSARRIALLHALRDDLLSGTVPRPALVQPLYAGLWHFAETTVGESMDAERPGPRTADERIAYMTVLRAVHPVLDEPHPRQQLLLAELRAWASETVPPTATPSTTAQGPPMRLLVLFGRGLRNESAAKLAFGMVDAWKRSGRVHVTLLYPAEAPTDAVTVAFKRRAHQTICVHSYGMPLEGVVGMLQDQNFHCAVFAGIGDEDSDLVQRLAGGRVAALQMHHLWGLPILSGSPSIDITVSMTGGNPLLWHGAQKAPLQRIVELPCLSAIWQRNTPDDPIGLVRNGIASVADMARMHRHRDPATPSGFDAMRRVFARCRAAGERVYLCIQTSFKYADAFVGAMQEILRRDAGAHLVLLGTPSRLQLRLRAGLSSGMLKRLHTVDKMRNREVLLSMALADVGLDAFPWSGGVTLMESISMGLPTVTLRGTSFLQNLSSAIYHQAGLDVDLVADSVEKYVARAVEIANDGGACRATVLRKGAPLFSDEAAQATEAAWTKVICDFANGTLPLHDGGKP